MRTAAPGRLADRVTSFVIAYFAASAAAAAIVRGCTWSLAAYSEDPIDIGWRLQLAWRALRGEWSLLHFQYPRGPLWQLAAGAASAVTGGHAGWTLALLQLASQWLSLAVVVGVVLRVVRPGWGRTVAVVGVALLTDASGVATFRAFLPLMVVVAHSWPGERAWRRALVAAGLTVASALVSLDRLPVCLAAVAVASAAEVAMARRRGERLGPSLRRLMRYGLTVGALLAVLTAGLALAGVDVAAAARGQLAIGAAYAGGMNESWRVRVVREHVGLFYAGCVVVGMWSAWRARTTWRPTAWLLASLPGAAFALVRTDPGHVALAMAPLLVTLYPVALGHRDGVPAPRVRWAAGALAGLATLVWFAQHPDNVAGHPMVWKRLAQVARGERGPAEGFATDLGRAVRWASRGSGCVGTSADLSALHALADVDGPTVLALRWDGALREALARRIAARACPRFVYSVRNYPTPGTSWPFGEDFLEIARSYEPSERLGVATLGLTRRAAPLALEARSIADPLTAELGVPGAVRVPLREPVEGTDLVEVELTLSMSPWRSWAGGTPLIEWRFERDGAPVSGWRWAWPVRVGGRARLFVASDTESAEWHWMEQPTAARARPADTLALRARPRGLASPSRLSVAVHDVRRWRRPPLPEPPARACDAELDLMAELRAGRAYVRFAAPRPEPDRFTLRPRAEGERLAEVVFDAVPCADTCVAATFALQASDASDGAEVEVHVLAPPDRSRLFAAALPPGGARRPFEASLDAWAERPVQVRFGALRVDSWWYDNVKVIRPRLGRCAARQPLTSARLPDGIVADGRDLRWTGRARLEIDATIVEATCLRLGADGRGALEVAVRDEGLEHVLVDRRVRGPAPVEEWSLHDFVGRRVTLDIWAPGLTLRDPQLTRCGDAL